MSYRIIKLPIGHAVVEVNDDIDGSVLSYDDSPVILLSESREDLLAMIDEITGDIKKHKVIHRDKYKFDVDDECFYAEDDDPVPVDEFFK